MESESEAFAREDWWADHRWPYNRALIIAGVLAFVCYVAVACTLVARVDPGVEITIFTTGFQGFGYLVAMGIANLFTSSVRYPSASFVRGILLTFVV